jgi:hypothetical protein
MEIVLRHLPHAHHTVVPGRGTMSDEKPGKPTIWTGAASTSGVLSQLDMAAPASGQRVAKIRAAGLRQRLARDLAAFVSRSTAQALRQRVK